MLRRAAAIVLLSAAIALEALGQAYGNALIGRSVLVTGLGDLRARILEGIEMIDWRPDEQSGFLAPARPAFVVLNDRPLLVSAEGSSASCRQSKDMHEFFKGFALLFVAILIGMGGVWCANGYSGRRFAIGIGLITIGWCIVIFNERVASSAENVSIFCGFIAPASGTAVAKRATFRGLLWLN